MKTRFLKRTAVSLAVLGLAASAPLQAAWAGTCVLPGATSWILASNGDWATPSAWSGFATPNSTGTDVCIVNGTSTVTVSGTQSAGNLQIGAGNGLSITTGNLILGGGSLLNDGTITHASYLELAGNATLSGTGVLTLAGGQIGTNSNPFTLTNQSTINGSGVIGSNVGPLYQNLGFANSGTVNANASGSVLSIQGTGGSLVNTGVLQASGNGILSLTPSGAIVNAGGTILADGGTVNLSFGSKQMVQGGTLTSRNGGILQTSGTGGLDGITQGAITLSSGSTYIAGASNSSTQTFSTGTLNLASGSILSIGGALELAGNTTLTSSGVATMDKGQIGTDSNDFLLSNQTTLQGSGVIGSNGTPYGNLSLANSGLIDANVAGQTLSIQGTGSSVSNTGLLRASNGGTLVLNTQAVLVNGGGSITAAGAGSVVNLQSQTLLGGTLTTTGGGVIQTIGSATLDASTAANGAITLANGSSFTAGAAGSSTQTLVAGPFKLGTGGGATIALGGALELFGDTTLSGAGSAVNMVNGQIGTNSNDLLLSNQVTIQGSGVIGSNSTPYGNLSLSNQALIDANLSGQTLSIAGSGSRITNAGTLRAINGATLDLNTQAVLKNSGGAIVANGAGSTVNLHFETVVGGTLSTFNGGLMQTLGNATLDGSTLGAITFTDGSSYKAGEAGSATQTFVSGVLNLGTGGGATIALGGALELTGNTTLNGAGSAVNMVNGQIGTNSNDLLLSNNVTIQGSGVIGSNNTPYGNLSLANNKLIDANFSGQTLSIQGTGSSVVNAGLMRATNGATLNLNTQAALNNAAGTVLADGSGSTVNLSFETVKGGILRTANGGVMQTIGNATLDASTLGALTLADGTTYTAGAAATATQTFVTGVLNFGTGGGATLALGGALELINDTTLNGTGGLVDMSSAQIGTNSNDLLLTNKVTLQGTGLIGSNNTTYGNLSLANQALIDANVSGQTLSIQGTGSRIVNTGTLRASSGGILNLSTQTALNNAAGLVIAQGVGSTVNLSGQTIQGGTLTTAAGGVMQTVGSATLDGQTLGALLLSDGSTYTAPAGTLNQVTGTINLGTVTGSTLALAGQMRLSTDTTIAGPGSLTLNGGEIGTNSNLLSLNNQALIQGQGLIGSNNGALYQNLNVNNSGTILANSAGNTLTIGGTGSLSGTGILQAAGGTLNLALNGPSTQGQLLIGDTGSALTINAQDLTLTGDYVNVQAGSGNSFSRRAGITGTGLILAGGDVAQAITGSTVTGGDTANATLTIGNVRVGANTFAYALSNTGSTGPSLRGAIQTSANGANISDARLSGSGVTPANYNTGGPGNSSAQYAVVFTVASAGPVAPLSGQVLNFTSNFDNIGDQQLSLVIGSTAAAYVPAGGSAVSPVQVASQRVGGSNSAALLVSNTTFAGSYSEDLNASVGGLSGPVTASGSIAGLVAGTSSNSAITVGVNTTSPGVKTGTVTLAYQTAGTVQGVANGLSAASVGSQAVAVSGNVYAPAVAQVNTGTVDFGIVHKGETVAARGVSVSNAATTAALNDTLRARISGAADPFNTSGSLSGLAAQASDATSLKVGLNTGTAGLYSSTASVSLSSHDAELADLSLGSSTVILKAQVNNYAAASFAKASGAGSLSLAGSTYTLNLGDLTLGGSALSSSLSVVNSASGLADLLGGSFSVSSADPNFQLSGFNPFSGVAAGSSFDGLTVNFSGSSAGMFSETLVLHGIGSNASGYSAALADTTLVLEGRLVTAAVPEPGTYLMLLSGLLAMMQVVRRRKARQ